MALQTRISRTRRALAKACRFNEASNIIRTSMCITFSLAAQSVGNPRFQNVAVCWAQNLDNAHPPRHTFLALPAGRLVVIAKHLMESSQEDMVSAR